MDKGGKKRRGYPGLKQGPFRWVAGRISGPYKNQQYYHTDNNS